MQINIFEIVEIEGKGVGFVASKDIEKGTVILREKPQFSVKGGRAEWMERYWLKSMMDSYKEMDKTEKEEFLKLCLDTPPKLKDMQKEVIKKTFYSKRSKKMYGKPEKILKIFNILEANAYCICNSTYLALQSARINHSCRPNAQRTQFRKLNGAFEIMAMSDIKKGEEITIPYTWSVGMKNRKIRQEILQNQYHFTCICKFCKIEVIDNSAEIYKEFQELVDGVEENLMGYTRHYQISGQTTEELKTLLISLKRMYELGKSKNMDPAGLYELCNEGFITCFKIACGLIIDDEFKLDAKQFAVEGEKLQKLYGFLNPEEGEWRKRQNIDEMIDNLIEEREQRSSKWNR